MKSIIALIVVLLAILAVASTCFADVYVHGYTKSNGTYVAPHHRSSPNSTKSDNWSTSGNTNPYTGSQGSIQPNPYYDYNPKLINQRSGKFN